MVGPDKKKEEDDFKFRSSKMTSGVVEQHDTLSGSELGERMK